MSFLNNIFKKQDNNAEKYPNAKLETLGDVNSEDGAMRFIRFGKEQDDYFIVDPATPDDQISYLQSVISKVVESPTQLAKIKAMPVENRPTLLVHGAEGRGCAGWCNGETICLCPSLFVNDYEAAGTFCHEFQHQEQFLNEGTREVAQDNNLVERMVNDRIYEAAADTAHYQYLYEVRHANPKAFMAYQESMMCNPGQRAYSKAKSQKKPEQECILAGMMGYATSSQTADFYAKDQFNSEVSYRSDLNVDRYARPFFRAGAKRDKETIENIVNGTAEKEFDVVHAFKAHTIGMTEDQSLSDHKIKSKLRSADMSYVASVAGRAIDRLNEQYKKVSGGKDLPLMQKGFWIRNSTGLTHSRGKDGLAGLWFKTVSKVHNFTDKLTHKKDAKESVACNISYYDKGKKSINLTTFSREENASGTFDFLVDKKCEREGDSKLDSKELRSRNKKMREAMAIAMKDSRTASLLKYMPRNSEMKFVFDEDVKDGMTTSKNEVLLNPKLSAFDLATQIAKQARVVQAHQKILKENPEYASYNDYVQDMKQKDPKGFNKQSFDIELKAEAERGLFVYEVCDKNGLTGYYKLLKDPVAKACMNSVKKECSLEKALFAGKQQAAKAWGVELEAPAKPEKQAEKVQEKAQEKTIEKPVEKTVEPVVQVVEPVKVAEPVKKEEPVQVAEPVKAEEVKKPTVQIVQPVAIKPVPKLQEAFKTQSNPALQKKTIAMKPAEALAIVDQMVGLTEQVNNAPRMSAEEEQSIGFVKNFMNNAVQKAGVESNSADAKIEKMKALAQLTKLPEGRKAFGKVMSTYQRLQPKQATSLQEKISAKGPVVVPQVKTTSMQSALAKTQQAREVRQAVQVQKTVVGQRQ